MISSIAIRVDLGEELTTQQSDSVHKLKVAILCSNVVLVIFFFLSKGSSILFLLALALLGELSLLFFKLTLGL